MQRQILYIITYLILISCSKNYKDAYIVKEQDHFFLKLIGRRHVNSHSPGDLIYSKTYNDSLLIPIVTFKDGIIKGEDIPVKEGYYKLKGQVVIKGGKIEVSLFHDNYDDKKLEPSSWNGNYRLQNRINN